MRIPTFRLPFDDKYKPFLLVNSILAGISPKNKSLVTSPSSFAPSVPRRLSFIVSVYASEALKKPLMIKPFSVNSVWVSTAGSILNASFRLSPEICWVVITFTKPWFFSKPVSISTTFTLYGEGKTPSNSIFSWVEPALPAIFTPFSIMVLSELSSFSEGAFSRARTNFGSLGVLFKLNLASASSSCTFSRFATSVSCTA